MKKLFLFFAMILYTAVLQAQPLTLKSIDATKEFRLKLYYGNAGKGAFVQYEGKQGIIPLRVKSYVLDTLQAKNNQPDRHYFVWEEMVNGKVHGTYQLLQMNNLIADASYIREQDRRHFLLELADDQIDDGYDKYLLHGAVISFNHFNNGNLLIEYPDGKKMTAELPFPDSPDAAQQSIIEDYNFDGYDDLAFAIPDAGMGVYHMFTIYLYNPGKKRFEKLAEPDYSQSTCSCLCDVSVNKTSKQLQIGCRGGASWHQDTYGFDKKGVLKWISSTEGKEE
ncbi:hypothetical protein SAMN05421639_102488 [Chryseobacterium shigense]|uniref:Repeat domain-containing protein n=1 Tax=Chryseobacterium shigense TaxID=297244 RepID=A0A1N7I7M0_9FLAO|nr:hypothetical protein [Chryseobacterium shigense]SIS33077.1 hypothetical protein SAMN05421639_102488 [Chryseobacterium shigense]